MSTSLAVRLAIIVTESVPIGSFLLVGIYYAQV